MTRPTPMAVSYFVRATSRSRGVARAWWIYFVALAPFLVVPPLAHGQGFVIHTFSGTPNPDPLLPSPGFGTWVSILGDLSGDGAPELGLSAPSAFVGGAQQAGQAYVYSGADSSTLFTYSGSTVNEGFGYPVAPAGDVNRDGVPDVVVGAGNADPTPMLPNAGQAHVFSGASGALLYTFDGTNTSSHLGYSVAAAGDANGDGHADVVVGAPFFNVGIAIPGQVKVFSGADGSALHTITGPGSFDKAGFSVAGGADFDGDGFDDFVVGGPHAQQPGLGLVGRVHVYSGANGSVLLERWGPPVQGHFGSAVALVGDVDGDGVEDVLAGAPETDWPSTMQSSNQGRVILFSGSDGTALWTIDGTLLQEGLGAAVAGAGDVDGDGVLDLLVGTNRNCGASCGINFHLGRAFVFSGSDSSTLFVLNGPRSGSRFGSAVDGGRDVDLDGIPDVFIGAPGAFPPGATFPLGQAYIYSFVGIPTGVAELGAGCAGTGGFAPKASAFGEAPKAGSTSFGLSVSLGLGGSLAALFAGTDIAHGGVPVGGCDVFLSGAILGVGPFVTLGGAPGTAGGGHRLVKLGIPATPALVGGTLHFQWAVLDGGAPNGLFVTSNALSVTIL